MATGRKLLGLLFVCLPENVFQMVVIQVLRGCTYVAIIGALLNGIVMFANGGQMPVIAAHSGKMRPAESECVFVSKYSYGTHVQTASSEEVKLWYLADWIVIDQRQVNFGRLS